MVYCTARIDAAANPSGHADQDVYLKALVAAGSVDHIEYGTYVARVKTAPLAVKDPQGRPQLVGPAWPVPVGVVNPSRNYLAGDLRGSATAGAGRHWWLKLTAADLKSHQLPGPVSRYRRPPGW